MTRRYNVPRDGFVRVVDLMGGDMAIVQAARISYGAGTKRLREDRSLIRYLMRNDHTSPFEMCEVKLHIRAPMDVWRQWVRHRTASVNEYSTRYSVAIDSSSVTHPSEWRVQSADRKQGSEGFLPLEKGRQLSLEEGNFHDAARRVYETRLSAGVAREQARKDLPLSTYTEAYWKIDLHNLLHFLQLRLAPTAQHEIREYARVIATIVEQWCPLTWEAFVDYRMDSLRLSRLEVEIAVLLIAGRIQKARNAALRGGLLSRAGGRWSLSREGAEAQRRFRRLGLELL